MVGLCCHEGDAAGHRWFRPASGTDEMDLRSRHLKTLENMAGEIPTAQTMKSSTPDNSIDELFAPTSLFNGTDEKDTATPLSCGSSELRPWFNGDEILTISRPERPDRTFRIYTPKGYNSSRATAKVAIAFHGWCGDGSDWTQDRDMQSLADSYKYVIVAPDGLGENEGMCNSWSFRGSTEGLGRPVTEAASNTTTRVATCDTTMEEPNNCYPSCASSGVCQNRCSWTQCQDDDVQLVYDLLHGQGNFTNALPDVLCFDSSQTFIMGASNGGMFTWDLIQDSRTSSLFAAAAPMIGLPHCDYHDVGLSVPVISLMSTDDETVSPSNLPYPGSPTDKCITNRDGEAYSFVSSHYITSAFALAGGCAVEANAFPSLEYVTGTDELNCKTWCATDTPYSLDCSFTAGHWTPPYAYEAAFRFFDLHSLSLV
jgi:poly(3-hydroxybutyrate) depolymerase